jgi:hypothetical protein
MTDNESAQTKLFRKMAEELECDEDEAAFEDKVRKVASAPRTPEDAPQPQPERERERD